MPAHKVPHYDKATGDIGFKVLDAGEYLVRVMKAGWSDRDTPDPKTHKPRNKHDEEYSFELVVLDGPKQEDGADPKNRKLFHRVYVMKANHPKFDPESVGFGAQQLKAMEKAFKLKFGPEGVDEQKFVGKVALAEVKQEINDQEGSRSYGQANNRINAWKAAPLPAGSKK